MRAAHPSVIVRSAAGYQSSAEKPESASHHVQSRARPHLAHLLLAAAAAALRRLGQRRRAAAAAGAWRPRSLPQLGLGAPKSCAGDWHIIAPDLRGHGDSQWSPDGNYTMAGYIYDLAQLIHQQKLAPVDHRRPFAGRQHRAALHRHLSRERRQAGRHRGARPVATTCWPSASRKPIPERMRDWIDEQRAPVGPPAAPLCHHRGCACKRMQEENKHLSPEQARHLTQHGVNQNEDGTYSWKFDNYVRVWPPYDMTTRRDRGAVGAHHLPDPAGLRQGELGLQPGRGRPRRRISGMRRGRRRRGRRPLGAPRPARRVPGSTQRFLKGSDQRGMTQSGAGITPDPQMQCLSGLIPRLFTLMYAAESKVERCQGRASMARKCCHTVKAVSRPRV